MTYVSFLKKLHHRESNPGHKRERLVCYQLHHNGLHYLLLVVDLFPFFHFLLFLLTMMFLFLRLLLRLVSWCSWLSHHFHVVRVPGSNPGGTILLFFLFPIYYFLLKKQRREVSINRPASYEPAALPLRHPALLTIFFYFSFSLFPVNFREKIPSPGIEPGAQT